MENSIKQYTCFCHWFCDCANMRASALFTGILTSPPQYEWHMHAKTPYSKQSAICGWLFFCPNACTCNVVKIPIMSMKCCEKSYVSCRPECVGWRKYLNCSDAITRCWHTDIHLLYVCSPNFIIWGLGSKVKAAYAIFDLFIVNITQAELL